MRGEHGVAEGGGRARRRLVGLGGAVAVATFGLVALSSGPVLAKGSPPSACTAQDAITAAGSSNLGKVIDTNLGCNVNGGVSTSMTGYVAVVFPAGVESAIGVDAISQPPAASGPVLDGTYHILFFNCSNGSITDGSGTYTVSGGQFPEPPPTPSGVLTITALSPGATVTCAYQVQSWPAALKSCTGEGCAFTNDLWVSFDGGAKFTQTASNSVDAPSSPPPIVSEAPLAIALPILALLLFGGGFYVVVRRRRMATTAQ